MGADCENSRLFLAAETNQAKAGQSLDFNLISFHGLLSSRRDGRGTRLALVKVMPEAERAPAKKKSKLRVVVAAVFIVVLGGAGIFFWMNSDRSTSGGESGAVAFTLPLETFVVNLSGTERGYLRVGIALGLSRSPSHKEDLPVALARDTILSVLSAVKVEELAPPDSRDKLKNEILRALKERAPQLGVAEVYFTEFLVQM